MQMNLQDRMFICSISRISLILTYWNQILHGHLWQFVFALMVSIVPPSTVTLRPVPERYGQIMTVNSAKSRDTDSNPLLRNRAVRRMNIKLHSYSLNHR